MEKVWSILSDNKIKELLGNEDHEVDDQLIRLLFVEVFNRIKRLEIQNLALTGLLIESGITEEEILAAKISFAEKYIKARDEEKESKVEFMAKSGISFMEWVNFNMYGKFE